MSARTITLTDELLAYVNSVGVREPAVLRKLREETAPLPQHDMQIGPMQGAFMSLLVRLIGARKCLEVGTFTGYSSTVVALALPEDGSILCCDVSREWTDVARRYWAEAGVADKIELRLAPAVETLDQLLAEGQEGSFDFAFIDADKTGYDAYYERALRLVRRGGLIAIDNTLQHGRVVDASSDSDNVRAVRALNQKIRDDDRVEMVLLPLADGLTLARPR
ncbi:MAG TPA: class I SAM-dependent methyltransferase [Candidatus Limnocylindria bacterium]|nr:class I SAM-dependent methyltransferase [Candidatus Limnocylindria bacterium]